MRSVITLIAERSGAIIGFASLRLLPSRRSTQRGELVTIEVLPEFRRTHIGWQLHQALEDWLRDAGGAGIELHVAIDNKPAIRFYQRLGYRLIAQVPRYYLETIDAWRMEKAIL